MTDPVSGVSSPPPLWRNRDFSILWCGDAVSALGSSMSTLVVPLLGYAVTGSTALAGLATTAVATGEVVVRLPAGALVDRISRGRALLVTNLAGLVIFASLAVATAAGAITLAHLIVAGFLSGAADAFARPATSAAIRTVVPTPQLAVAYTRLEARDRAVSIVGPPIGGALYTAARSLPFVVDTVSYAAAAFAVTRLKTPLPAPAATNRQSSIRGDVVEGLRFVWSHRGIRAMMLWAGAINLAGLFVFVTVTLRLIRAGVHPAAIGLVDTVAAVAGVIGALAAPAIVSRARTGLMAIALTVAMAVTVVPIAFTTDVVAIGALFAASTFLVPATTAGISAYLVSIVPNRLQGRVNSAAGVIAGGLTPLAPLLAGLLLGAWGAHAATLIGAALTLVSVIPLVRCAEIRNLGRPDTWTQTPAEAG